MISNKQTNILNATLNYIYITYLLHKYNIIDEFEETPILLIMEIDEMSKNRHKNILLSYKKICARDFNNAVI